MGIVDMVKKHEGLRLKPYRCPAGKLTIGWGRNLEDVGINREEAEILLMNDLREAQQDMRLLFNPVSRTMTLNRWEALLDMRFQLGGAGFRKFEKMLLAVQNEDWDTAANECMDSLYAKQTPNRAIENAEALKLG